jgi:hypothetical protein
MDWLVRSPVRAFVLIFVVGFSVRATVIQWVPREYFVPHTRWEVEAIAVSLTERGTFADPYAIPTGATAHVPPVYPGILSVIYRVFGLTFTAGVVAWMLGAAIGAATFALLPWFAGRVGLARQAGLLGGLAGAALPHWLAHAEALTALALCLLLAAFLRRWTAVRVSMAASLLLGLAWGAAFLLQPALLPVSLGCVGFELWWLRDRRPWRGSAMLALGVLLACAPWSWRNYTTFHHLFFVRSNFGLELRVGNHPGATADIDVNTERGTFLHPRTSEPEAVQVRDLGEIGYMQQEQREALAWIGEHPGRFAELTAVRFLYFWLGPLYRPAVAFWTALLTLLALLGMWRSFPSLTLPQRATVLIPLVTFPLVYYVLAYMVRYRIPTEWILFLMAGAGAWHWLTERGGAQRREGR